MAMMMEYCFWKFTVPYMRHHLTSRQGLRFILLADLMK